MTRLFVEQMPDSFNWVIQHHPRASESAHLANPFPHVFPVAVGRAFLAGSLLLTILACGESLVGIFFKPTALLAKASVALFPAAVQLYHHGYCMLLSFYPSHWHQMI